jgi:hypothetical protein
LAEQKEKKQETPPGDTEKPCRDLICAEEWKDPASRKVVTEYHKKGLPKEMAGVEADLETFERYWKKKGGPVKVKGEYHKNGAPFLDKAQGLAAAEEEESSETIVEAEQPEQEEVVEELREQPTAQKGTEKKTEKTFEAIAEAEPPESEKMTEGPGEQGSAKSIPNPSDSKSQAPEGTPSQGKIQRPIDIGMIEMVSYALFRVAFRKGVSIPIKRDGMLDMDVTVKGKEITINTNQLYFSVPELNVWHIVYQHKGKPILEIGRGVKNGLKIHRLQAIRLGLEMWNGSRKMNKLKLKQLKDADKKAHAGSEDG